MHIIYPSLVVIICLTSNDIFYERPDVKFMDVENKRKEYPECMEPYPVDEYYKEDRKCSPIIDRLIAKTNLDKAKHR